MSRRFLLDENLPPRAAELLAHFGFPVLGVGLVDELPRGTPDARIAHWCAATHVVWITVDRDPRKDSIVSAAVVAAGTSVLLLLLGKGMRLRGYLLLLVRGLEHWRWERLVDEGKQPYRARVTRNGKLAP